MLENEEKGDTMKTPPLPQETETPLFNGSYEPMENGCGFFRVIETVLKRPAQVLHEIIHGKMIAVTLSLLVILILSLGAIGLIMASYSGGQQFLAVPTKIILGTLLSAGICMPSLYILLCLSGGEQTFPQVCGILLKCLALAGILFVGFMPVAWIFSQATDSIIFMGILYLLIWGTGISFGLRLLIQSFSELGKKTMPALRLWGAIFVLVVLQMSTTLRPLLGSYAPLQTDEKKFFVGHWIDVAEESVAVQRQGSDGE